MIKNNVTIALVFSLLTHSLSGQSKAQKNPDNTKGTTINSCTKNSAIALNECSIEVKLTDENGSYNWYKAKEKSETIGQEWRLPSKSELACMYKNKEKIGGFKRDWYWTSEKIGDWNYFVQSFSNGKQFGYSGSNSAKLRCVRTLKKK